MGTDIHTTAERRLPDGTWKAVAELKFYDYRNYALFGWLADVRNYSGFPPYHPDRGLPKDISPEAYEQAEWNHSATWYTIEELISFDYDQPVEDLRVTREIAPGFFNGGCTAEPGGGEMTTYRAAFGDEFIEDLHRLKAAGVERLIFSFDS